MAEDFYKTLGVNKGATKDELKTAFRKLAHQHHPDKNKGDDKKFKEINEAYQTLSDDTKRAQYDRFGAGYQNMGGGGGQQYQGGFGGGFEGFDFSGFQGGGGVEFDLNDIFSDFFGGAHGYKRTPRGRDMQTEIEISVIDAMLGVEKKLVITGHKEIKIVIPAGIHDGQTLKMTGMGESVKDGKPGDLYINVHVKTPQKVSKKAKDLLDELRKEGF